MRVDACAIVCAVAAIGVGFLPRLALPNLPLLCGADQSIIAITGISSGIGRDAAVYLASQGYTVVGTVRKESDMQLFSSELGGGRVHPILCDVTDSAGVERFRAYIEVLRQKGFRLIALVNNAGILARFTYSDFLSGRAANMTRDMLEVNTVSVVRITGSVLPMLERDARLDACGTSRIVNVGSIAGLIAAAPDAGYSASKGALERSTDAMRRLFLDRRILVSLIQPGYVESGMCQHTECLLHQPRDTTTPAIVDAITSNRPRSRYVVSSVDGFPVALLAIYAAVCPDSIQDLIMRVVQR